MIYSFIAHKIDDSVANAVSESKLAELGLVYGDVIAFKAEFCPSVTSTFRERAAELKRKIKRTEAMDKLHRPIHVKPYIKVLFCLKCFENKRYRLKINKSFQKDVIRGSDYDFIHLMTREGFKIPENIPTHLGDYKGTNITNTFRNVEYFAACLKEKKKTIQVYLYCPKAYSRLIIDIEQSTKGCETSDTNNDDGAPSFK